MSSHSDHARWDLCRNPITRSRWIWVFLLLFTSPTTRGIAVGGTMLIGTGCEDDVTYEDCDQALSECLDDCAPDDAECRAGCDIDAHGCYEEAYETAQRHRAWNDAASMCFTFAVCTLETLGNSGHADDGGGDGDGEGDGDGSESGGSDLDPERFVDLPEDD